MQSISSKATQTDGCLAACVGSRYGYVDMGTFAKYSAGAASGGGTVPSAYTTQEQRPLPPLDTLFPPKDALNWWEKDGTPVIS